MTQNLSAFARRRRTPMPATTSSNYAHPPLVAVVMRVEFSPTVADLTAAGDPLAERLGPEWQSRPSTEDARLPWHPAIANAEQGVSQPSWSYATVLDDQRIRVAPTSLEFAWDGRSGEAYPHYEAIRDGFVRSWDAWADTASALRFPVQTAVSWRLSYLNRIPRGTVWQDLDSCQFLLPLQQVPQLPGLGPLQQLEGRWTFPVTSSPELAMTLTVDLATELATSANPVTSLWLNLHCAGLASTGDSPVLDGFDAARSRIVESFGALVTPAANEYWGLRR